MTMHEQEQRNVKKVEVGSDEHVSYVPAGFWMRLWAYLIDLLVVSSLNGIIIVPIFAFTNLHDATIGFYSIAGIFGVALSFAYFSVLTKIWQQTIGKRIMGVKVQSDHACELTWGDVLIREVVGRYIHQSIFITNALYLIIPFHESKKGIHDMIADTLVILEPRNKLIIKKHSKEKI
ncbi:RDD family protein [Evansella sp. AB-P1]|uniref:RDD family protein n=1 Tax=Evansella sp. AB-P1 TaxID=3037653 RepID=UPI00241CC1E0|nr:RDD family protein [Evansella sp. AB-P1]MDG5787006.1 RDD family protein [Evansella sp. AB-P1]